MKLVFVTNLLNHHQAPLADVFYKLLGDDYKFIATVNINDTKGGVCNYSDRPYLIKPYENATSMQKSIEIINEADVVIIGASSDAFIRYRLKHNLLTFRYGERWLKRIRNYFDYPRKFISHTLNRNKKLYYLAASAYMANDLRYLFAYPNKCFKWGYFTAVEDFDIDNLLQQRGSQTINIMWCARFLKWKHPELVIQLAQKLKTHSCNIQIDMYGDGEQLLSTMRLAEELDVCDVISFKGAVPNDEIIKAMQNHHIFLFTSDKGEGWGAVLNEAMSNGCTVVVSDEIGAAPYLVTDKQNGRIFKSGDLESLYTAVVDLIENPFLRNDYAKRAYISMHTVWSPENAAHKFIHLVESLLENREIEITDGPCSRAEIIKKTS